MVRAKRKTVRCPWCKYSPGCPPKDCSFKDLPMEKELILKRMQDEVDAINDIKRQLISGDFTDSKAMVIDSIDRAKGLSIMFDVLNKEFGMNEEEVKKLVKTESKLSALEKMRLAVRFKTIERGGK